MEIATRNETSTVEHRKKWQLNKVKITGTAEHVRAHLFWQNYKVKDSHCRNETESALCSRSLKGIKRLSAGSHISYLVSLVTVSKEVIQLLH